MLPALHNYSALLWHNAQVYERAVANLPPGNEKRFWQRYIYLWIKYALFEELDAGDMDKAREVYR
jgi:crooked neck